MGAEHVTHFREKGGMYAGREICTGHEMQMMGMQFGCTGALQRLWVTYMLRIKSGNGDNAKMDIWNELGLVFSPISLLSLDPLCVNWFLARNVNAGCTWRSY